MKVRILVCLAGADMVLRPGDVVVLEADEAARLVAASFAEPVEETPAPAEESATEPAKRRKK